jgi:hypothetical protein
MAREDIEADHVSTLGNRDYEPPVVFDFGSVFDVTRGNGSGSEDDNGQEHR